MTMQAWYEAAELPIDDHPDDEANTPRTAAQWAEQAGRYAAERDLLLKGIHAIQDGLSDGTGTAAWRALLRTVEWMEGAAR